VEVVVDFVRLDPDERGLRLVHRAPHLLLGDVAQGVGELLADEGEEVAPERAAAPDLVLPQARLRLVDAERHRLTGRRPLVRRRQALLVQAVPPFVHQSEEGGIEEGFVVAHGQPHIVRRERGAERVRGDVEPAGLEVEAHQLEDAPPEARLPRRRERAVEEVRAERPGAADLRGQRDQSRAQSVEDAAHLRRRHALLVPVEERIVRLAVEADRLGVAPPQGDQLLQERGKDRELILRAGLLPGLAGRDGGLGQLPHEFGRDAGLPLVRAANLAEIDRRGPFQLLPFGPADGGAHFRRGGESVRKGRELSEMPASGPRAARRQVRFLVPGQDRADARVVADLAGKPDQLVVVLAHRAPSSVRGARPRHASGVRRLRAPRTDDTGGEGRHRDGFAAARGMGMIRCAGKEPPGGERPAPHGVCATRGRQRRGRARAPGRVTSRLEGSAGDWARSVAA